MESRKAAKAERNTAKNQVLFDVMTQEDLTRVEQALHPESEQRGNLSTLYNNEDDAEQR